MSSADKIHVVLLQESRHDVWSKSERDAAVVLAPASDIFIGIRPQQIAEEATIRYLVQLADHHTS